LAGLIPSLRHGSETVASRRNPSRTIWIFSSGVYLRRVALRTLRIKRWGFLSALLGLLSGRHGFMSGVNFMHRLAPSSGIYPRELNPADLSISSGPKTVPLLLKADSESQLSSNNNYADTKRRRIDRPAALVYRKVKQSSATPRTSHPVPKSVKTLDNIGWI
jgi:hypothetical protein